MKQLVIVESPTKAKTISRFLGKDYTIKFSMGHIMDLPKSKMGIDMEHDFTPQYQIIEGKKTLINELKSLAKSADTILLATDPDREGEAISANIQEILTDGKGKIDKTKFKRIVFHEITEEAIKEALESSRQVDTHLVDAQTARRVLDRLVGYQLSPILWKKVRRGLSAGRVQSVALRLIVEREREIEKFGKEPYFTIHGLFLQSNDRSVILGSEATPESQNVRDAGYPKGTSHDVVGAASMTKNKGVEFALLEMNKQKVEVQKKLHLYDGEYTFGKTIIDTKEKADDVLAGSKKQSYTVSDVNTRQTKRSPYPPFTTSTLQQQSAQRFGLSGKRTMGLAQKLYEEGFITYHRTDSVNLSPIATKQMRAYAQKEYGDQYIPAEPRQYFTKQKNAQEAHEAIRPTKITRTTAHVKAELGEAYGKLYNLIWKRALASQMSDAQIESTTVYADGGPVGSHPQPTSSDLPAGARRGTPTPATPDCMYRFKATGSVLLFDGFLKLTPQALEDNRLPKFVSGDGLMLHDIRADEHQTMPPPRYNDASIIKTLEEKSIGRPSTYATIIGTIIDRGYIERVERKFIPTTVGSTVNDFLVTNFATIDDVPFTAQMEDDLDLVANGEKDWHTMMKEFYDPFSTKLTEVEGAARVKIPVETTGEECPECHEGQLVIRTGKFGKFFSCDRFPDCKFTKPFVQETNAFCPKDGGKILMRKTRKGRKFFGCANYPNCDFASWKLEDIKKTGTETTPQKRSTRKKAPARRTKTA